MYKVLIVDDEPILRKGIVSLIDWHSLDCTIAGESQNGREAVSFLSENEIDIVVTDIKMPGMDGLTLAKEIQKHHEKTKVIIITAFSEFSYAREALKAAAQDYVIKTNFVDELPATILETIKKIKNDARKNIHTELLPDLAYLKDFFLKGALLGSDKEIDAGTLAARLKTMEIGLSNYFIIVSEFGSEIAPHKTDAIKRFYHLAFGNHKHHLAWLDRQMLAGIISFEDLSENAALQEIVMICNEILSVVSDNMSFGLNFGVSARHDRPDEIALAYEEAVTALTRAFQDNSIVLYKKKASAEADADSPHESLEQYAGVTLLEFVFENRYDKCEAYLTDIFERYRQAQAAFDIERLKIDWLIICATCFRHISERNIANYELDKYAQSINKRILNCKSIHSIYSSLCDAFSYMCALDLNPMENKNYLVSSVNKYIRDHYESRIKLDDIANSLHINASYLSRIYKKHTGDSIFTAINKYRVEKAKFLLEKSEYKISEIALAVGFDDASYFTNVFTKYVGESPKNYKFK